MENNSRGQNAKVWDEWWGNITPLSEIRMWDFYGGRHWILKYVPRYGKVIEGGCGLGRYNFYLRRLGIDINGIDFSEKVINRLNTEKNHIDPSAVFIKGDIRQLPYHDNSISGYISLGVVEHFIEGPQKTIAEAFRVLRPGGVAIFTTPNYSWYVVYRNIKAKLKGFIKQLLGMGMLPQSFFQYEYTPYRLKKFVEEQGFYVSRAEGCDLLYTFLKFGLFKGTNNKRNNLICWLVNIIENTWFKRFGGQSITISVKKASLMYCFLSGKFSATPDSLEKYDIPIAKEYQETELAKLFLKNKPVRLAEKYTVNPPLLKPEKRFCQYSGKEYITDEVFEDFGFNIHVSPEQLKMPERNIKLSVENIRPIWRKRGANFN